MKGAALSLFLLLSVFSFEPAKASTDELSVQCLEVIFEDKIQYGSGFFISPEHFLTANHNLKNDQNLQERPRLLNLDWRRNLDIAAGWPQKDFALLKVKEAGPDQPFLKLGDSDLIGPESKLKIIGCAKNKKYQIAATFLIKISGSKNIGQDYFLLKAEAPRGFSGAPVINQKGEVAAIVIAKEEAESQTYYRLALPINYVKRVLGIFEIEEIETKRP